MKGNIDPSRQRHFFVYIDQTLIIGVRGGWQSVIEISYGTKHDGQILNIHRIM